MFPHQPSQASPACVPSRREGLGTYWQLGLPLVKFSITWMCREGAGGVSG